MTNLSEHNASAPSNFTRPKGQTCIQTKSSNLNEITARHPARNRDEMGILQKADVRTPYSFDVLSNLKDARDYHQSKVKEYLYHDSAAIHPNYNSN
jgi:hypothetical protein